jgi:tRNA-splicing ligase RtcB
VALSAARHAAVPAVLYATADLIADMDDKVYEQLCNVATLPGIVGAACAMPDAHWGYGFPIGGVAAFDPREGGVISAGGVGFDISCGVRTLLSGLTRSDVESTKEKLADALAARIPAGVGSTGALHLDDAEMENMLLGGAGWAVKRGYGTEADLERTEELGIMAGAMPEQFRRARRRNKTKWVRWVRAITIRNCSVAAIYDARAADVFGSDRRHRRQHTPRLRGLGHQTVPSSRQDGGVRRSVWHRSPDRESPAPSIGYRAAPSRRDARRHQLRARQSPDHHAPRAAGVRDDRAACQPGAPL